MVVQVAAVAASTVVVAVDVGKTEFGFSVTDAARTVLLKPRTGCPMTGPSLARVVAEIVAVLSMDAVVRVGIEAAGHYHRPLLDARWPVGWEVLELNPGHVTEQRRVLGKRTIKTDVIDLQAMTELLLAGRGQPIRDRSLVLGELTAWSAHRTGRVSLRTATRNRLLGHLDRSFPGLTLALPDVLATKVGRLVAAEFADPARLAALGSSRFPFTTPVDSARLTARRTRTRRRDRSGRRRRRHAATSLAPGSFAMTAARTKPDDPPNREVAYVSVGARHPTAKPLATNRTTIDSAPRSRCSLPALGLDATYSQLGGPPPSMTG